MSDLSAVGPRTKLNTGPECDPAGITLAINNDLRITGHQDLSHCIDNASTTHTHIYKGQNRSHSHTDIVQNRNLLVLPQAAKKAQAKRKQNKVGNSKNLIQIPMILNFCRKSGIVGILRADKSKIDAQN